jgi:DNA-binding NarL/FixJ family response regulator
VSSTDDEPVIDIYIADPVTETRRTLRGTLRTFNFESFEEFTDIESLRRRLTNSYPDLMIVDADLPGGDACKMTQDIRTNQLGPNPFVPIIMTSWDTEPKTIKRVIESGVDGLLLKPMSVNSLKRHVDVIMLERKPFLVTSSYIGPDRRTDPNHKSNVQLIDVPNTLKAKRLGQNVDLQLLDRLIADNIRDVNGERLRRNAFEISFLLGLILPAYEAGLADIQTRKQLNRIQVVATDIGGRLADTEFAHVADLCQNLLTASEAVAANFKEPPRKDFQLMKPLSDAILAAMNPDRPASDMAGEISNSISNFQKRK